MVGEANIPDSTGVPAPPGAAAKLTARLVYDTRAQALPTGIRAGVKEGARRLLFEAGEYEVLVRVSPNATPEQFGVVGQVLSGGIPLTGATVTVNGAAHSYTQTTDRTGGFKLPEISGGQYAIEFYTAEHVVAVPALALTPA